MHALSRETPRRTLARQIILDFWTVYLNAHDFCIIEHVHVFYYNNKAVLQHTEAGLPQVYQTTFSSPRTYVFCKFSATNA